MATKKKVLPLHKHTCSACKGSTGKCKCGECYCVKKPVEYNKLAGYNNGFKDGYAKGVQEGLNLAKEALDKARIEVMFNL